MNSQPAATPDCDIYATSVFNLKRLCKWQLSNIKQQYTTTICASKVAPPTTHQNWSIFFLFVWMLFLYNCVRLHRSNCLAKRFVSQKTVSAFFTGVHPMCFFYKARGEREILFFMAMAPNNPIRREIRRQLEAVQGSKVVLQELDRSLFWKACGPLWMGEITRFKEE